MIFKKFTGRLVGKKIKIIRQHIFQGKKFGGWQKYLVPGYVYEVVDFFPNYDCGPALKLRCLSKKKWGNQYVFAHNGEIEFYIVKGEEKDFLIPGKPRKLVGFGFFEFDKLCLEYSSDPEQIQKIQKNFPWSLLAEAKSYHQTHRRDYREMIKRGCMLPSSF